MIRLSHDQIILLHRILINRYGGTHGIRDEALLDSALNAPFQSFGDVDLYPSIIEKAARLGFGLVMNHPFQDGNKRIAALAMLTFLNLNHFNIKAKSSELSDMFLSLAAGTANDADLFKWINNHLE